MPECSAEATAVEQGRYALGLLVVTSLLQAAAKQTRLAERFPHVTEQCTAIAGMCVGWAVGDAVVKAVGATKNTEVIVKIVRDFLVD